MPCFIVTDPRHFTSFTSDGTHGATFMRTGNKDEYLKHENRSDNRRLLYPYWYPGGEYIAYSTNNTRQSFHTVKDERVEVLDLESDVVVYHPADHHLLLAILCKRKTGSRPSPHSPRMVVRFTFVPPRLKRFPKNIKR